MNNVLGFPFIFRGALDVRATGINEQMKLAAAQALAELARAPVPAQVAAAYGGQQFEFGPEYIIPKPFDSRVLAVEAMAVAKAACDTGVARQPISDWEAYRVRLEGMTNKSLMVMHSIRSKAKSQLRRIVFAEAELDRVLEACRIAVDEGYCHPVLLGRPDVIETKAEALGLDLSRVTIKDPAHCPNLEQMAQELFHLRARNGYDYVKARRLVQRPVHHSVMMLRSGEADGMVCGADRSYVDTLRVVLPLAGLREGVSRVVGMHVLMVEGKVYIFADTTVSYRPDAKGLAEIGLMAAQVARHFNLEPVVAYVSFSNFGDNNRPESRMVREAVRHAQARPPGAARRRRDARRRGGRAGSERACRAGQRGRGARQRAGVPGPAERQHRLQAGGRLGQREVIGPVLYGLKHPINLVNARSSVTEIVNMAALSAYEVGRS